MLETLFSFHGRLTRLGYFGLGILLFVLLVADIAVMVFVGAKMMSGKGAVGSGLATIVLLLLALLPLFWANLAITARRLRDAGFPPLFVMPAMFLFSLFDQTVIGPSMGGASHGFVPHGTLFGACVSLIYAGVVLFWPSEGRGGGGARSYDLLTAPDPVYPASPIPSVSPLFSAPLAAAPVPAPSGPPVFGRRRR